MVNAIKDPARALKNNIGIGATITRTKKSNVTKISELLTAKGIARNLDQSVFILKYGCNNEKRRR